MSGLREILLRLTAAGLICSALMALAGRAPGKEILRFGCACLTVILLIGAAGRIDLSAGGPARWKRELEAPLEEARQRSMDLQLRQAEAALEDFIAREGEARGIPCRGRVVCEAREGVVTVREARILWQGGSPAGLPALQEAVAQALGIPREKVTVKEAGE